MATIPYINDSRDTAVVRVLVVEDFEPFRQFIRSKLNGKPELQIIGELSDGGEAVLQADDLRPDLILLDVGLPTLNGIEAARRVSKLSPKSKILVVSQETSADIVQEAFQSGASGYVFKSRAGTDLLPAVEAVLGSRHFVSGGLAGYDDIKQSQSTMP
jgi:DNA-binding NarL/FixJ family response regulator